MHHFQYTMNIIDIQSVKDKERNPSPLKQFKTQNVVIRSNKMKLLQNEKSLRKMIQEVKDLIDKTLQKIQAKKNPRQLLYEITAIIKNIKQQNSFHYYEEMKNEYPELSHREWEYLSKQEAEKNLSSWIYIYDELLKTLKEINIIPADNITDIESKKTQWKMNQEILKKEKGLESLFHQKINKIKNKTKEQILQKIREYTEKNSKENYTKYLPRLKSKYPETSNHIIVEVARKLSEQRKIHNEKIIQELKNIVGKNIILLKNNKPSDTDKNFDGDPTTIIPFKDIKKEQKEQISFSHLLDLDDDTPKNRTLSCTK